MTVEVMHASNFASQLFSLTSKYLQFSSRNPYPGTESANILPDDKTIL
jgi:hypothetical protein